MRKKFITNLALVLFLNILVKPFWVLGIDRSVQNIVGAESYGLYFSLFNLSLILNIILDFGITNYNNKNIAQHNQLLSKLFKNIVSLKFILGIFYAILCLTIGLVFGYTFHQFYILFFLILNQFLLSFILYLRSNISGLLMFKTDSLISVLDRFLMIAICSFLLWSNFTETKFKIEWFIYTQTISYLITAFVAFIVVSFKSNFQKMKFDKPFLISILKQTYPYAILVFLMGFYNRFDGFIIERILDDGKLQAGIYAQGFRLLDAVSQFSLLFAGLLLPIFSKMLKNKEPIKQLLEFSFILLLTLSIITVLTSIFYSNEIINLLYPEHVSDSSSIFSILIISFIPISTTYIFGTLLTANGNIKELNIMAFSGVILNLCLNLLLIPKFNALGAAVSALITQIFTAVIQMLISVKKFNLKIKLMHSVRIIFYIFSLIIVFYVIKQFAPNWYFGITATLLSGILIGLVFKLLDVKTFYNVLKFGDEF